MAKEDENEAEESKAAKAEKSEQVAKAVEAKPASLNALQDGAAVWVIASADRPIHGESAEGAIAMSVIGLPPSGNVTLETVPAGSDLLLNPAMLWVTEPVKVAKKDGPVICHIVPYVTYGQTAPLAMTGTTASPISVAALDPTAQNQLWILMGEEAENVGWVYTLVNVATNQAIGRSNQYAVPGSQLEMGTIGDAYPHHSVYHYQFNLVSGS